MKKYILTFISVFVLYLIGNSIYVEMTKDKTPGKAKRLECQRKVTSFERSFDVAQIQEAQQEIKNGALDFSSSIEKATYAESALFEYISLEQTDVIFQQTLASFVEKKVALEKKKYRLSYYIYENDLKDPGKKTKKSKEYAGYVVLQIKNSKNKTIYKVQIDFMDFQGADINQSVECAVKSFMTYAKK